MRHAQVWGLVALPDGRRLHAGPIPVVGGLAMGFSFILAWIALDPALDSAAEYAIPTAAAVALLGGAIDDRRELGASGKFAFQIVAAALVAVWGEALLTHVGHLASEELFTLGRWSLPLTLFAIVGVMNAINMTDGVDGLAVTSVLCACLGFGLAAVLGGDGIMFAAICLTGGAAAGFFVYNARLPGRGPAPVYMGDSGSLLLGLLLAWCAIQLAMGERPSLVPITAVWILGVPIADTVTLMIRRALRGRSPFCGDREHVHHILIALGLSTGHTVLVIAVVSLLFAIIALAAQYAGVHEYVMFYVYVIGLVAYGTAAELLCRRLGLRRPVQ
jgi:UDP-GlcNAc:undecaprenyl-phosphate/decaprenyl-phosphate GlcNAc-1-phosphate transferase